MSSIVAGIEMRRLRTEGGTRRARARGRTPPGSREFRPSRRKSNTRCSSSNTPAARLVAKGESRLLLLDEVEALLESKAFVVDGCRYVVRDGRKAVSLAKRPVLFTLIAHAGGSWPDDVPRDALVARAFRLKLADESHRARLRVEMGRLRSVLRSLADVSATQARLCADTAPRARSRRARAARGRETRRRARFSRGRRIVVHLRARARARRRASAPCNARSIRSPPPAKCRLSAHGRARRWMTPPMPGFTTTLLLPAALPID